MGVEIPHYCWHPALSVVASCRMCLVEIGQKKPDGSVAMQPKLIPGCQTPVTDGMVIVSDSEKVKAAQKATLEYLLLNHPLDCPTCDQAGECLLQDYSYRYGRGYSRLQEPKKLPAGQGLHRRADHAVHRSLHHVQPLRAVHARDQRHGRAASHQSRHARGDRYLSRRAVQQQAGRQRGRSVPGRRAVQQGFSLQAARVVAEDRPTVCARIAARAAASTSIESDDRVYRLRPRPNPLAQGHFMCDEGRFGWKYVHSDRAAHACRSSGATARSCRAIGTSCCRQCRPRWSAAGRQQRKGIAAVLSPWMTLEEAYLLASYLKSLSPNVSLAMGPVRSRRRGRQVSEGRARPADGAGEVHDPRGEMPESPRRGSDSAALCRRRGADGRRAGPRGRAAISRPCIWSAAIRRVGSPTQQAAALENVETVVVQDILPSPASERATFVLPGGSFAERDGTFVNHAGLAQEIHRAIRGAGRSAGRTAASCGTWPAGAGCSTAASLRQEMGETIESLRPLACGELGEYGVRLR